MARNRFIAVGAALALALSLSACSPSATPPLPPKPTAAEGQQPATPNPEYDLSRNSIGVDINTQGLQPTEEQKKAFWDDVLNSADINTRMIRENLSETFIRNLGYIGATAPDSAVTNEVTSADLSGNSTEKNRLDGLYDSEFSKWVSEKSGISQDSMYYVVVLHTAQLGIKNFRG